MTDADEIDVAWLVRGLPARFAERTTEVAPGSVLAYDATSWQDAIVFVTAGEIELECSSGERRRFHQGDILCLAPIPVRLLRNVGTTPARLLAIWRRRTG
jgi:quercetin dioxygenase-like cupin family protein